MKRKQVKNPVRISHTREDRGLRNQSGRFDTTGKSSGAGRQVSEPVMLAAAQVEKETRPSTKQQWIQASGPEEGSSVSGLLASSLGDVYAASRPPLRFERFNEITFAGSIVYVATDAGVLTSEDGEHWRALTDTAGTHSLIERMAVDTTTVYGVGDEGVYRLNDHDAWEKIAPEVPDSVTALVVNNDRLYIVTEHRGMFHVSL